VDPLTWPDVFAAALGLALFAWPLVLTTGRVSLIALVVLALAVVIGAKRGAAALAREQRAREDRKGPR
jgi:heme exporter protein D